MSPSATHRAIDAVWRIESARLIAGLTRIVRDVAVAEDLAQDALVAALEQWPESGIPDKEDVPAGVELWWRPRCDCQTVTSVAASSVVCVVVGWAISRSTVRASLARSA